MRILSTSCSTLRLLASSSAACLEAAKSDSKRDLRKAVSTAN